jgi:hypothetical protein
MTFFVVQLHLATVCQYGSDILNLQLNTKTPKYLLTRFDQSKKEEELDAKIDVNKNDETKLSELKSNTNFIQATTSIFTSLHSDNEHITLN